ncbi:hypothetical protein J7K76_04625 [Candidatus Bipolaricaulota bacterium]|nr:hypothetical protein [Candidatus Bipolaricaulota bacterium]
MKRVGILALACVMVWGVCLMAKDQKVSESCKLDVYWTFEELSEYDLYGSGYQNPAATGWFSSYAGASTYWHLLVTTNRRLKISFDFSKAPFSGDRKDGAGTYTFPTQFYYRVKADKALYNWSTWYSTYDSGWRGWHDAPTTASWLNGWKRIDPVNFEVWVAIRILRSGYADPAGTYTSKVTCTVSVP